MEMRVIGTLIAALLVPACGPGTQATAVSDPVVKGTPTGAGPGIKAPVAEPSVQLGACYAWADKAVAAADPAAQPPAAPPPPPPKSKPPSTIGGVIGGVTRRPIVRPRVHRRRVARRPSYYNRVRIYYNYPTHSNNVNRYAMRNGVMRKRYPIERCYKNYLRQHPNKGGKVEMRYVINPDGKVVQSSVAGFDAAVSRCVQRNIAQVTFARPRDGNDAFIKQVITFRPRYSFRIPKNTKHEILGANTEELQARAKRVCVRRPRPNIASLKPVLDGCYRKALKRDPKLGGRMLAMMHLHADGGIGSVTSNGLPDRQLARCVAEAIRTLPQKIGTKGGTVACTVTFHNPQMSAVMSATTSLSVSRGEITLQSKTVGDTFEFDRPKPEEKAIKKLRDELQMQRFAYSHVKNRSGIAMPKREHLALHAHPAVGVRAIRNVLDTVWGVHYSSVHYSRAIGASTTYMSVNPLGTPSWRCQGAVAPISIFITDTAIQVRGANVNRSFARKDGRFDFDAVGKLLASLEAKHGSDLDIAAADTVHYRVVLNTLERAVKAGFFDARFVQAKHLAHR